MLTTSNLHDEVEEYGFAIREKILSQSEVTCLLKAIAQIDEPGALQRRNSVYAVRNLLDASPDIFELANSAPVRALVAERCDVYRVWSFGGQWL